MSDEPAPIPRTPTPKKLQWNEVTWYSKLLSIVFFIAVLPVLTFYIGREYERTEQILNDPAPAVPVVEGADSSFEAYTNSEYNFSLKYPQGYLGVELPRKVTQELGGLGAGTIVLECENVFLTCLRVDAFATDAKTVATLYGTSNVSSALTQELKEVSVGGRSGYRFRSFFSNMGETCIGEGVAVASGSGSLAFLFSRCGVDTELVGTSTPSPQGNRMYNAADGKVFEQILGSISWAR